MKKLYALFVTLTAITPSLLSQPGPCQGTLISPCVGTFSRQGYFFNVVALSDLRIDSIATLSQNGGSRDVIVMYKHGSHVGFEMDTNAWTSVDVKFYDPKSAPNCPIPSTTWPWGINVVVTAGDTLALYIQITSGSGSFEGHNDSTEGCLIADDGYLQLFTGKAQSGNGIFTGNLDTGITFQGELDYTRFFEITATASDDTICEGESVTLSVIGNVANSAWQPVGIIGNTITVSPTVTTTYTVTSGDSLGCTDSDVITVVVEDCSGMGDVDISRISINPNPTDGGFAINLSEFHGLVEVVIHDLLGHPVSRFQLTGGKTHGLTSPEAAGTYFVEVRSGGMKWVHRVMVQ